MSQDQQPDAGGGISQRQIDQLADALGTLSPAAGAIKTVAKYAGLPTINVILLCGLAIAYWVVKHGIPAHLEQIQAGYTAAITQFTEALKETREHDRQKFTMVVEQHKDALATFKESDAKRDTWFKTMSETGRETNEQLREMRAELKDVLRGNGKGGT